MLNSGRPHGRPFGEPSYQLIQEFLGADLELKRVSAILNTNIEQLDKIPIPFSPWSTFIDIHRSR